MIYKVNNLKEMKKVAQVVFEKLVPKDIITLEGELGSGKTTLVQMIAKLANVKEVVTSPTFEIAKIYQGDDYSFTHIDAYRLENRNDLEMFDEYIYNEGFTFIEWPKFLKINGKTKSIEIKFINNQREVRLNGFDF